MSVTGMTDDSGCMVGVLASFRDLTELMGLKMRMGEGRRDSPGWWDTM